MKCERLHPDNGRMCQMKARAYWHEDEIVRICEFHKVCQTPADEVERFVPLTPEEVICYEIHDS